MKDLDPELHFDLGPPRRIRCFVRGCQHLLRPPTRSGGGDICPEHGIRCHSSGTYSYADIRQNFIIDANLVATRIVGHPDKYDSKRLGMENSEDAVTWNVFRSLQKADCLHHVANLICGSNSTDEPQLYLWGLSLTGDTFDLWDLLVDARKRFEGNLPVKRPLTEPDIALYLPGEYLILIEAKFTSPNSYYSDGKRKDSASLTKAELLAIYQDDSLRILNAVKAVQTKRVHYQLWRNLIFAEWMAARAEQGTQGFLGSLTRRGHERESCAEFSQLSNDDFQNRFRHIAWEDFPALCPTSSTVLDPLCDYLRSKTASRMPAFDLKAQNE